MRSVTGPLATGTYTYYFSASDYLPAAKSDGISNTLTPTEDKADEDIGWYYESLGNDRYKAHHKKAGNSYRPAIFAAGAVIDIECDPNEWIVKETETKGEYSISPVVDPSLYAHAARNGSGFHLSTERVGWKYFKLDD
ncbi:hypothetical protein APHAL10511_002900 [Amanita phalloides]|nr:hypothetical protein APHAL10511_002900 [Amanita phalloides]